jgi:hypothetical protein
MSYALKIESKLVSRHETRSSAYAAQEAAATGKVVRLRRRDVLPGIPYGAWVIARGYRSGVNAGKLVGVREGYLVLERARKIWYWNGAAALPEVAVYGVDDRGGTKICRWQTTLPVQQTDVSEVYVMQPEAVAWLESAPEWTAR